MTRCLAAVFVLAVLLSAAAPAQSSGTPWTVTITPRTDPLPIGSCGSVSMTLKDSTGKDAPRNPQGWRVSLADFDLAVTAPGRGQVIGVYDGASSFSVCACQAGRVGETATITATYPANALAAKARVAGVAFRAEASLTLAAARGTFEPPGCKATRTTIVAGVSETVQTSTPGAPLPVPISAQGTNAPGAVIPAGTVASPPTVSSPDPPTRSDLPATQPTTGVAPGLAAIAPPPTGVSIAGSPLIARLSWTGTPSVQRYVVWRSDGVGASVERTPAGYTATQFVDTVPDPRGSYRYTVEARYANGASGSAPAVAFTSPAMHNPIMVQALPTAPQYAAIYSAVPGRPGVQGRVMQDTPGNVALTWAPVAGAKFYVVRWNASLQTTDVAHADIPILVAGSYAFAVVAYFRNESTKTNFSDETTPARVTVQVGPANALQVVPELYPGIQYLRLHWKEPPDVTSRELWRVNEGESVWTISTGGVVGKEWAEARPSAAHPLSFGQSYRYRLILHFANGGTVLSPQTRLTMPAAAKLTLSITSPSRDLSVLRWNAMPGATSYVVWWTRWDPVRLLNLDEPLAEVPASQLEFRHLYSGPTPRKFSVRVMYADPYISPTLASGSVDMWRGP